MYRKKRAFSLIEILIAFILAGILFGCIFSNFSQTYKLQSQVEKAHAVAINRQGLQLHMQTLLAKLPSDIEQEEKKEKADKAEKNPSPIYIADCKGAKGKGALWFSLKADYDSDRRFTGPLSYCLYHDEKSHALQLLTRNESGDERKEVLMRQVKSLKISLFDPEKGIWTDTWPQNAESLPTLLKLQIVEKDRKKDSGAIDFAFFLPAASQPIDFLP